MPAHSADTVAAARRAAMAKTAAGIQSECRRDAGGDFARWDRQLAPFRADLARRITPVFAQPRHGAKPEETSPIMPSKTPPLLYTDCYATDYLAEWFDHAPVAAPRRSNSYEIVRDFSAWLKARNIDLIFVPAPRVAEVYPDLFADHVPADKIAYPRGRKMLLDLIHDGVEVVDLLPPFLQARRESPEPLYYVADVHWNDRAQRIAAAEIAAVLRRYAFVQSSVAMTPKYAAGKETAVSFQGSMWPYLTEDEHRQMRQAIRTRLIPVVERSTGKPVHATRTAPILMMGDSYTSYSATTVYDGSGVVAQIALGINQPLALFSVQSGRSQTVKEILRDPGMLAGVKVVIWLINQAEFQLPWDQLPAPATWPR